MPETVLVTGAGSGIGRELVRLFVVEGAHVLAVSLVQAELDQLRCNIQTAEAQLETLCMDLATPQAAEQLVAWCEDHDLTVGTLVNNAGFACFGPAVGLPADRVATMIALNVTTLTGLSMRFGAQMKARGRGRILNVGSTAGMVPYPNMAAYCASKAYVNSFTLTLAAELRPHGVTVTLLAPGATRTRFAEAAGILDFAEKSRLKELFLAGQAGGPEAVALAGYRAMLAGRTCVVTGTLSRTAILVHRLLPQSVIPGLRRRLSRVMGPP